MKTPFFTILGLLLGAPVLAQTAAEPVALMGYTIGQRLLSCPEGSRTTVSDHSRICTLGPGRFAGLGVVEHSVTLFNGAVIGTDLKLAPLPPGAGATVLADLRQRLGEPDRTYSRPDLESHVWTRSPVVVHFDAVLGTVSATDVIRSEVAKLRAAPSNQFDF